MKDITAKTHTIERWGQWVYPVDEHGYILSKEEAEALLSDIIYFYHYAGKTPQKQHNDWLDIKNLVGETGPLDGNERAGYIYVIRSETREFKIGRTKNIPKRMQFFGVKLPFRFDLVLTIPTPDMFKLESLLHKYFESLRCNGEWFDLRDCDLEQLSDLAKCYDT